MVDSLANRERVVVFSTLDLDKVIFTAIQRIVHSTLLECHSYLILLVSGVLLSSGEEFSLVGCLSDGN